MRSRNCASLSRSAALTLVVGGAVALAAEKTDRGIAVQKDLDNKAMQLFGVNQTLDSSSTTDLTSAQIQANPGSVATLANGLSARVVSAAQTGRPST